MSDGYASGAATTHSLRRAFGLFAALALAIVLSHSWALAQSRKPGTFDYYTLSLSWSPTYCATKDGADDSQQCGRGRAYASVIHGLWPQYESGWLEFCEARESWVPNDVIAVMLRDMPSRRLIIHEWKKHGTCSGLTIAGYFEATRTLFDKIRVPERYLSPRRDIVTTPEQLVRDFVKTNRDLTESMMSVQCGNSRDRARLSELRICFDRAGAFRACGKSEARSCRAKRLVLPPVRGGS